MCTSQSLILSFELTFSLPKSSGTHSTERTICIVQHPAYDIGFSRGEQVITDGAPYAVVEYLQSPHEV